MNLKIYEKTNYPGIYRNKKNKNYIVDISAGNKEFDVGRNRTTISTLNGKKGGPKILKISEALNIQRNPEFLDMVKFSSNHNTLTKDVINEYLDWCLYNDKQDYSTVKKKKSKFKVWVTPYIGNKKIKDISEKDIISIHKILENSSLSNESKRNIHKDMAALFNWCVNEKIIRISPIKKVKNFPKEKTEMSYWTPDEFKKFRDYLDTQETYWAKLIHLITTIGISLGDRIGETRVLRFSSIKGNQIEIAHSINYDTRSKDKDGSTKNFQSQRLVDISESIINEINDFKKIIELNFPVEVKNNDYIFMNPVTKEPYSDSILRKHFYKYCDLANVKRIRLYDLRHTSVALLMELGWELYHISERLGHKNYSTTVEKYGHLSNEIKQKIANSIDKFL
ncbi:MAG TPA: site-specific integrase [Candidatus Aphodocola excrementigallinarum]|uniref:Site-specific integrase n=1 Tax=Candidatus Aphodocola excrementigallinarum TaxID=2840670 RepID=A0A9D1LIB6_9FIRM|nr:site-specific integrase [Candidatus Aphodocola excrementigallinarum]